MTRMAPYIGVTGFMNRQQVEDALALVPPHSRHQLMVGVLISNKTFVGKKNKWPGRYPTMETVNDIFVQDPRILNLVHYTTDDQETLAEQLDAVTEALEYELDGFQLNLAWPDHEQLHDYRRWHPDKKLVLQVGARAMAQAGSIEQVARRIEQYGTLTDGILIDPSSGKGLTFDPKISAEYLRRIQEHSGVSLGIAGGLSAHTMQLLDPLIPEFPQLSIDAESRLRTPFPEDALDLPHMRAYLNLSFQKFSPVL